ncbi:MAG TPA: AraC family transcriptional regulator, partial [Solirubrobacteraceae bacterium]
SELAGRVVALEDVLGRPGRELVERLADAPDHAARFALLDAVLTRRLSETAPTPAPVAGAYGRLAAAHGRVRIGDLAAETGWSRRHLVKRLHDHVGLGPKALARVLRFGQVVARCGAEEERLADLAYECGYADQAHLNREFRALAGVSPSRFLASRLPDAGGVVA